MTTWEGPGRPRVLLVEDDDATRGLIEQALRDEGFDVTSADDAASATRLSWAARPDVAIIDYRLPDETGLVLCRSLAERDVACLILSGYPPDARAARDAGVRGWIQKPFRLERLVEETRRLLRAPR